jgi:hypothetical protein
VVPNQADEAKRGSFRYLCITFSRPRRKHP